MRVSRWQAFAAALLMAASFLAVWIGMNVSNTLTNYTVHPPGEAVTVEGNTYRYRGMFQTQVIQGTGSPTYAAPGMTWVAVVIEVTAGELPPNCSVGLTDVDQLMTWTTDQSSLLASEVQSSCYEITEVGTPVDTIAVFEVPTSQVDRLGGVVINPSSWRSIAEVIR